jgi:hypothetical protein
MLHLKYYVKGLVNGSLVLGEKDTESEGPLQPLPKFKWPLFPRFLGSPSLSFMVYILLHPNLLCDLTEGGENEQEGKEQYEGQRHRK